MSLFSMLKGHSRRSLEDNWGKAALVNFFPAIINQVLVIIFLQLIMPMLQELISFMERNSIYGLDPTQLAPLLSRFLSLYAIMAGVSLVATFFVLAPLSYGVTYWNLQLTKGNALPFTKCFHFFESGKRYKRALHMNISLYFRRMGWGFLFIVLPYFIMMFVIGLITALSSYGNDEAAIVLVLFLFVMIIVLLASVVFFSIYMNKYFLAVFSLAEDDETPVSTLIKRSITQTKGNRGKLFTFELSFIGWSFLFQLVLTFINRGVTYFLGFLPEMATGLISGILGLCIGIFLTVYISISRAMYARYLIETNGQGHMPPVGVMPNPYGYPPVPPYGGNPYMNNPQQPPYNGNPYMNNPQQPPYNGNPYANNPQQPPLPPNNSSGGYPPQENQAPPANQWQAPPVVPEVPSNEGQAPAPPAIPTPEGTPQVTTEEDNNTFQDPKSW